MIIRKARIEDLLAIQDLSAELFKIEQQRDPALKMDWPYKEGKEYFVERITKSGVCFVAEEGGQIIGYQAGAIEESEVEWRPIRCVEAENMLVKEEFRGRGVGTALLKSLIEWAKEQGAQKVMVSAYASNERAIELYKRMGFKPYAVDLEIDI